MVLGMGVGVIGVASIGEPRVESVGWGSVVREGEGCEGCEGWEVKVTKFVARCSKELRSGFGGFVGTVFGQQVIGFKFGPVENPWY